MYKNNKLSHLKSAQAPTEPVPNATAKGSGACSSPWLSAVVISFNEERNIRRCIMSLQGVADEILVVDSFSTDNTPNICKGLNVNFVQNPWDGYAEQKNFANSIAKYDWILSLDADEALSDTLKQSILEVKQNIFLDTNKNSPAKAFAKSGCAENSLRLFSMNRCTNYCGKWIKHCGWYPDKKIRLFNKKNATWKNILIHEHLEISPNTNIKHLKGDILHYSYYTIQDHINQANKFTDLTAQLAFDKKQKSSIFNIFFNPKWKFFQGFILKLGFLDGYHGYMVCKISAFATYLKYSKLLQLSESKSKEF